MPTYTPTRITAYNSTPAGTAKAYISTDYASLLDTHKHSIIISPDLVDKTGRDFADSLILIVSDKDAAATYLAAANYDGNNLIKVLTGGSQRMLREVITLSCIPSTPNSSPHP